MKHSKSSGSIRVLVTLFFLLICSNGLGAQTPEWIWHDTKGQPPQENEESFFRKEFTIENDIRKAVITTAGDDQATVFLNGKQAARNQGWNKAVRADVTKEIKRGKNTVAAWAKNNSGDAAFIFKLELELGNGEKRLIVSDPTWLASGTKIEGWERPEFASAANWKGAVSRGKLGVMPWGDVLTPPAATPVAKIQTLPGYKIELIRSAEPGEGSWVAMSTDPKGRLIISPQEGGLLRVTLTRRGQVQKIEPVPAPVGGAMGMLYAFDSLYVSGEGPNKRGLYRLRDLNGNDQFDADEVQFLKQFDGGGEHGPHGIALGPDNKLYIMNGNHTKVPEGISPHSAHKNYAEDLLLPRMWDAGGHAVGILAPGGYVVRTDAEGKRWELFCGGFRNAYDLDFNHDGELFTFDSDMEWDWGTPWYRPTRVYHAVSGGEYGWRSGSGKWPSYYPDNLPGILDVGIGSPTGVKFGTQSHFPPAYQRAFYIADWSYGRILAVHLQPNGASYRASKEPFVFVPPGTPLNVADIEFGRDGAMFFITGGRGTQSGLYRVTYSGKRTDDIQDRNRSDEELAADYREARRKLESLHGVSAPERIDEIWRFLNNGERRRIRYAARIALESQDVHLWKDRALSEERPEAAITALTALVRTGDSSLQDDVLRALGRLPWDQLTQDQKLRTLRVLGLAFSRMGPPSEATAKEVSARLDEIYPASNYPLNHELSQLQVYLRAPNVIEKTLALLDEAPTQEEQLHYIFVLRNLKDGWTLDQRARYFSWFNEDRTGISHYPPELVEWFHEVGRQYTDGASYPKFLANIKKEAAATLSQEELSKLQPILEGNQTVTQQAPAPQRAFVADWTMEDLAGALDQVSTGRNFKKGEEAFIASQCLACHRFGNQGGASGPDLTAVSSRFARRDLLDSIINPSRVLSEQFQNTRIFTKDGEDVTGRIVNESDDKIVLVTDPISMTQVEIPKTEIERQVPSQISPMPEDLVNILTKDEILDLLAYIESGGNPDAPAFKK